MNYELKELTESLINKELYDMYQDIPNGENGQTNKAVGITYDEFINFIKKQIRRKYNEITYDDTPTISYIFYVNNYPVGYICLRTKIDDNWIKWSGNFYYQVRKSERRKGYGTKMLSYALDEFRKMKYKEVYGNASLGNIGSQKIIENNGGIFLYDSKGTYYYKIILNRLSLYIPKLEDYWYEEKLKSDPNTMSYNAGYDVTYYGYHYDTGCIDYPKEKWEENYNKRKKEKRFFAYILDGKTKEYIGYCNYQYNKNINKYECDILIESKYRGKGYSKEALRLLCNAAKQNGIKELYDTFEIERGNTLELFKSVGFKVIKELTLIKFNKDVNGVTVKIEL